MKYLIVPLVLTSLLSSPALSQYGIEGTVIEGTVTTAPDDRPAAAATVRIGSLGIAATVDSAGRYRLVVPDSAVARDPVALSVQLDGYLEAVRTLTVRPGERRAEVFRLQPGAAVVSGRVTNLRGEPEAAVLVRIEALNVGASTGADGAYRLVIPGSRIRPGQPVQITASRAGLAAVLREAALSPGAALTQDFQLGSSVILLEDVVVTGTGGVQVREAPAAAALQSKVAGAMIISDSGEPSASPFIRLRGATSLTDSLGEPLYLIDGMILSASSIDVDALDIESIEVVKGAAAASLYGSRASNGVVQITTRWGNASRYVIGARGGALRWTPDFPWPPPRWTTRHDLPANLLEGSDRTLGGVFGSLRDALIRAGYDEWAVYALGADGFVVVARREVIDESGEPIPPRWEEDDQVGWGEYFRSLVFATPGRYRIVAIVVSPRGVRPGGGAEEEILTQFVVDGSRMLPPEYAGRPLLPGTQYTALIYEFYRRTEDSPTRLVTRSRITSVQHLANAQLWTRQELLRGRQ